MNRRHPIRPRRREPRTRAAPQEDAAWWEYANHLLAVRSGGACERCGRNLVGTRLPYSRHHRQRRRDGGDRLSNLLLLCGTGTTGCHGWITEHPDPAQAAGWIVPALGDEDPAAVPVRLADGWLYLLDDAGGRRLIP